MFNKAFLKKYFARYDVYLILVCLFKGNSKSEWESKGEFCFHLGSWRVRSSKEKQIQTSHGLHRWISKKTKDLGGALSEMLRISLLAFLKFPTRIVELIDMRLLWFQGKNMNIQRIWIYTPKQELLKEFAGYEACWLLQRWLVCLQAVFGAGF